MNVYRHITLDCTIDNLKREKLTGYEHGVTVFEIILTNQRQRIDLSNFSSAQYFGTKADNHTLGIECEIRDNKVLLPVVLQMTTCFGYLNGSLVLQSETGNIRFYGLNFEVFPSPETAQIESTDENTLLESFLLKPEIDGTAGQVLAIDENGNTYWEAIDSGSGVSVTVDQAYNPESENAQSGKAVAEATKECAKYLNTGTRDDYTFDHINNTVDSYRSSYGDYCLYAFGSTEPIVDEMSDEVLPQGYYVAFRAGGATPFLISSSDLSIYSLEKDYKTGRYTVKSSRDISDVDNYYTDKTIDGAFAELGAKLGDVDAALDHIITMQENLIGGASE